MTMGDKLKNLIEAALTLDDEERAELADILMNTLPCSESDIDPTIEAAWKEEIDRRWDAYQRGETETVPLEEVLKKLRSGAAQRTFVW
jgi:putative addiction module component (TIGR02574 family)